MGGAPGVRGRWPFVMGYSVSVMLESELAGSKSNLSPVRVHLNLGCHLSLVLSIIFMDRISRHSQVVEGVGFDGL